MNTEATIFVSAALAGQTVAGVIRTLPENLSWAEARRLIASRRVRVNGNVCLDDARRLKLGETLIVAGESGPVATPQREVRVVYADADLVVVDKPAGIQTVRRNEERNWSEDRKSRQPVLEELIAPLLPAAKDRNRRGNPLRVRSVHRLDSDTSGLMLFALSATAEQELIQGFANHQIERMYQAVAHGIVASPLTIDTWLLRDRGDGIRGSAPSAQRPADAKHAVTHVRPIERIGNGYTLIECRLETGRTHQIRIHLAERGHMLCGENVYVRPSPAATTLQDHSGAPRQALHSMELQFTHPVTGKLLRFEAAWPKDMARWMQRLRTGT